MPKFVFVDERKIPARKAPQPGCEVDLEIFMDHVNTRKV
jgi:hypothetical protein